MHFLESSPCIAQSFELFAQVLEHEKKILSYQYPSVMKVRSRNTRRRLESQTTTCEEMPLQVQFKMPTLYQPQS